MYELVWKNLDINKSIIFRRVGVTKDITPRIGKTQVYQKLKLHSKRKLNPISKIILVSVTKETCTMYIKEHSESFSLSPSYRWAESVSWNGLCVSVFLCMRHHFNFSTKWCSDPCGSYARRWKANCWVHQQTTRGLPNICWFFWKYIQWTTQKKIQGNSLIRSYQSLRSLLNQGSWCLWHFLNVWQKWRPNRTCVELWLFPLIIIFKHYGKFQKL